MCFLASALAGGMLWAALRSGPPVAAASTLDDASAPTKQFQWRGGASCAAAACHNANGTAGTKGSEYSTWISGDPHARAFTILFDKPSRRIVTNLYHLPDSRQAKPEQDSLCLKCHGISTEDPHVDARLSSESSLSCESCHGPAEQWLARHYLPGWRQKSAGEKAAYGMRATKDLLVRADTCVSCHVGSPDREVNHDLIAAGHPRLSFEYSSFLAILPKHWDEREEKQRYPDLEVRTWAIGQAVSARAALELLASRADSRGNKPWPEFAEYDCFACHHDLQGASRRQQRDVERVRVRDATKYAPGSLPWGTWYMPMLPEALGDRELTSLLQHLRLEMGKPSPTQQLVAQQARIAADRLRLHAELVAWRQFADRESLNHLLASLARDDQQIARANWDGAAQVYLALAAVYHAQGDLNPAGRNPMLRANLNAMAGLLKFPRMERFKFDSPREKRYLDSGTRFLEELGRIQDQFGR